MTNYVSVGNLSGSFQRRDCFPEFISDERCRSLKFDATQLLNLVPGLGLLKGEARLSGALCTCQTDRCRPCPRDDGSCDYMKMKDDRSRMSTEEMEMLKTEMNTMIEAAPNMTAAERQMQEESFRGSASVTG